MGHIICIVNNKGGVGKTTIAVNLAHAFSNQNKKILLLDLDSQCNASSTFFTGPKYSKTLYDIYEDNNLDIKNCIYTTDYHRVSFIPNIHDTAALEPSFAKRNDYGWYLIREKIRDYAIKNFDLSIIDCPPNLGAFSIQAMIASDFIIVPVEAGSRYATDGLNKTVQTIEDIKSVEGQGKSGIFLRLVINKADRRTSISKITIDNIIESYDDKVCNTVIPINTDIQQAELVGKTVIRHASQSAGARAFRDLSNEIDSIINIID